ncbi:MAG: PSP1 domain-containing protein [Anaerolineae bacterium]
MDVNNTNRTEAEAASTSGPTLVGVRFQPAGKPYHFVAPPELALTADDWVVVDTVYGEQVGQVTHLPEATPDEISSRKLRNVIRRASGLDMARYYVMEQRAERLVEIAREEVQSNKLDLKIASAEFTLDGNSAIVLCTGNVGKKDFSALRRRLASRMSCRVELRSIGPRDHAKVLNGLGVCGEPRCCGRFLTDFQAVSIRMAKDQAISMAPSDITGMCGRLRCCLAYEHEVYQEEAKSLPRVKARVKTDRGLGRVIDLDILKGDVIVEIPPDGPRRDRERFRYAAEDVEVVPRGRTR